MAQHTPGPWRTYDVFGEGWNEVFGPKTPGSDRITVDSKEDARLIAAAPDLLAACMKFMEDVSECRTQVYEDDGTAFDMMQAAIDKATKPVTAKG